MTVDHEELEREIFEHIEDAEPKMRPVFLSMVKLTTIVGDAVKAQTELAKVQRVHGQFIEAQCAAMNQAKGGSKVLKASLSVVAFLLLSLQSLGVYMWVQSQAEIKALTARMGVVEVDVAKHRAFTEAIHGGNGAPSGAAK